MENFPPLVKSLAIAVEAQTCMRCKRVLRVNWSLSSCSASPDHGPCWPCSDPVVARYRRLEDAANQGIIVEATAGDSLGETVLVRVWEHDQDKDSYVEYRFCRPIVSKIARVACATERSDGRLLTVVSLVRLREATEAADEWFRERHAVTCVEVGS